MATVGSKKGIASSTESVRLHWLNRLAQLVDQIEAWTGELDWVTRRIEVKIEDSQLGTYRAPALLMQKATT
jgi:hypothetical protein